MTDVTSCKIPTSDDDLTEHRFKNGQIIPLNEKLLLNEKHCQVGLINFAAHNELDFSYTEMLQVVSDIFEFLTKTEMWSKVDMLSLVHPTWNESPSSLCPSVCCVCCLICSQGHSEGYNSAAKLC